MTTDFYNAFLRHMADADLLLNNNRWANADHHYGLAAECLLKALLLRQGVSSDAHGDIANDASSRPYKVHINKLWQRYTSFSQRRNSYCLPRHNPFHDWDITQRYAHDSEITEQTARAHAAAVDTLNNGIVRQARLNGDLP